MTGPENAGAAGTRDFTGARLAIAEPPLCRDSGRKGPGAGY